MEIRKKSLVFLLTLLLVSVFFLFFTIFYGKNSKESWQGSWECLEWKKLYCKKAIKVDCNVEGAEPCGDEGQVCCHYYINPDDKVEPDKQNCRLCKEWELRCVKRVWVEKLIE
ncbi:MAG: hypothetical protein ACTSYD_02625 [Candidatus Heimdallarchaeaceae archaeon]